MKRAALVACVAAAGAALGVSASASATTFCVPAFHPACPNNGANVAEANVETAMGAEGDDGVPDLVLIAPGEVSSISSIVPEGSDPLTVRGSGPDATTITVDTSANVVVLDLYGNGMNTRDVTVEDLKIAVPNAIPAGEGFAVQLGGDTLDNVAVVSRNAAGSGAGSGGVSAQTDGGVIRNSTIGEENGGSMGTAVSSPTEDTIIVEDTTIDGAVSAVSATTPGASILARRVSVTNPLQIAFGASAGLLIVQNSTVQTTSTSAVGAATNSANDSVVIADHLTAVNSGPANIAAIASNVFLNGTSGDANLTVTNSIFRGFGTGWQRQEFVNTTGAANLTVRYSNLPQSGSELPGAGGGTLTTSNLITEDPLFAGPADFHLTTGSPSIDAGDPAA